MPLKFNWTISKLIFYYNKILLIIITVNLYYMKLLSADQKLFFTLEVSNSLNNVIKNKNISN